MRVESSPVGSVCDCQSRLVRICKATISWFLAGICVLLACSPGRDVLATYRGGRITKDDVMARVALLAPTQRSPKDDQPLEEWERQVVEDMALERVLVPARRLEPRAGSLLSPGPWCQLLAREYARREGQATVEVPAESIAAYYSKNWSQFYIPEGAKFQHIFLALGDHSSAHDRSVVRRRADSLMTAAKSGASFDELVEKYSASESKAWQGKVGMIFRGQLPEPIEEIVFSLSPGEVGGPAETEHGYHVIRVIERTPGYVRPLEEVSGTIRQELAHRKLQPRSDEAWKPLDDEFPASVNPAALFGDHPDSAVVLSVAGEKATRGDLVALLGRMNRSAATEEEAGALLRSLAQEAQLYRKACAAGLDTDPELRGHYRVQASQAYVDSIVQQRLNQRQFAEDVLRNFFAENAKRFATPQTWHVREIVVPWAKGDPYGTWRRAQDVVAKARSGADFASLATQVSSAPSAADGGDLGTLTLQQVALRGMEFHKTLVSLQAGQISEPARIDQGYLILKAEEITPPVDRSYEEVQDLVRTEYVNRNHAALRQEERHKLLSDLGFEFLGRRG